jgi:hypothetical protein
MEEKEVKKDDGDNVSMCIIPGLSHGITTTMTEGNNNDNNNKSSNNEKSTQAYKLYNEGMKS